MSENQEEALALRYADVARSVMKRQAALGLRVAAVFLVMIVGLPLYNMYLPQAAAAPVLGFTSTWLFLGVGFFPITWLLSAYFVRESDRIESEATRELPPIARPPAATEQPGAETMRAIRDEDAK